MSIFPNLPSDASFYALQSMFLKHALSHIHAENHEEEKNSQTGIEPHLIFINQAAKIQKIVSVMIEQCSTILNSSEGFKKSIVTIFNLSSSDSNLISSIMNVVTRILWFNDFSNDPDLMTTLNIIYYLEYFEQIAKEKQNVDLLIAIGHIQRLYMNYYNQLSEENSRQILKLKRFNVFGIHKFCKELYATIHFLDKISDQNIIPDCNTIIKELTYKEIPSSQSKTIVEIRTKVLQNYVRNAYFLYHCLKQFDLPSLVKVLINFASEKNYCEAIYDFDEQIFINPILFIIRKYPTANSGQKEFIIQAIRWLLRWENENYLKEVFLPVFLQNLITYQFEEDLIKELFQPYFRDYFDSQYAYKINAIICALSTQRSLEFIHYLEGTIISGGSFYFLPYYYDQQGKPRIIFEIALLHNNPFNVIEYIYDRTISSLFSNYKCVDELVGEEVKVPLWQAAIRLGDDDTVQAFAHRWYWYILYYCTSTEESVKKSPFFDFLMAGRCDCIPFLLEVALVKNYVTLDTIIEPNKKSIIRLAFEQPLRDEVKWILLDYWFNHSPVNKNEEGLILLELSLLNHCNLRVVQKLIENGIYVHDNDATQNRILQLAKDNGASSEIQEFLYENLNVVCKQKEKDQRLLTYFNVENYEALQKMADEDPDLLLTNKLPLLIYLMMHENSEAKISEILNLDLNINCEEPLYKKSLLQTALENQTLSIITKILDKGGDIHHISSDGISAESMGLSHRSLEVVKKFVEKGANVNLPDHRGITPIQNALSYNRQDIVEYLLAHGAELNWKDPFYAPSRSLMLELLLKEIRAF